MIKIIKNTFLAIGILTLVIAATAAAVPQNINYQGVLRDSSGNLVTGNRSMVFTIYDQATGGTSLWTVTSSEVAVSNGLYTIQLSGITPTVLGSGNRWLEVAIAGTALTPRLKIASVAYAVTAGSSHASTSDYATVSGTATNAAYATVSGTATNAASVDGFSANSTATADQLLALDSNKQLKGMSVSAEASDNNYALWIKSGKIGVKTGSNVSVGTGQLNSGLSAVIISNTRVTGSSLILLTVGHAGNVANSITNGGILISARSIGINFTVRTMDGAAASDNIPFSYLIIN